MFHIYFPSISIYFTNKGILTTKATMYEKPGRQST